jgi:hypothetical protein
VLPQTLSTSANWAFNFMVVMITPVAFTSIGYQTYIIFAVINAFIFPVVYFFYPETAYRSLEEMDIIFRKTTSVFNVVKIAKAEPKRYDSPFKKRSETSRLTTSSDMVNMGNSSSTTKKPKSTLCAKPALYPPARVDPGRGEYPPPDPAYRAEGGFEKERL